ncbi:MAG: hypothetical protein ACYSRZ_08665 [Planctomycetota bacterium]|jgi:hypothetical protein
MADSNIDEQPKGNPEAITDSRPRSPKLSVISAGLLRYRKVLIIASHIVVFAVSLMLSFLLASNMQFSHSWLADNASIRFFQAISRLVAVCRHIGSYGDSACIAFEHLDYCGFMVLDFEYGYAEKKPAKSG